MSFGDDQLKPQAFMGKVLLRIFLMIPVGAVGTVLCISVVGLPIGIPLMLWVGAFVTKPMRQHPRFNVDSGNEEV